MIGFIINFVKQFNRQVIKSIIKLRIIQTYRAIAEIGIFRILILLTILFIAFFYLFSELSNTNNKYYISVGYFVIIFFIHIKRLDTVFLKIYLKKYKTIQFIEYIIISIPLIIGLLINSYVLIPFYVFAIIVVVHIEINIKKSNRNTKIQRLIPYHSFEWKAGVRKNLFPIYTLWILGLTTSFFIGTVPIVILILAIFQISFLEKCEDLQIILAFEKSSTKFISFKIKNQILLFFALVFPLLLAFLIFHFDKWYIITIELIILLSLQVFFVILKYAFYKPGEKPVGMQMYSSFGVISIFMPAFIPVVWILTIYLYFKSLKKLNFYLNDYN